MAAYLRDQCYCRKHFLKGAVNLSGVYLAMDQVGSICRPTSEPKPATKLSAVPLLYTNTVEAYQPPRCYKGASRASTGGSRKADHNGKSNLISTSVPRPKPPLLPSLNIIPLPNRQNQRWEWLRSTISIPIESTRSQLSAEVSEDYAPPSACYTRACRCRSTRVSDENLTTHHLGNRH